jgi:hypothetical protein
MLNATEKYEYYDDEENHAYATRRAIAPIAAVLPTRQSSKERQDQKDDQNGSKHCLFLSK